MTEAGEFIDAARRAGLTVSCAESLTGGALSAALVDIPGASAVVRGGIVSYATDLKHELLGVDAALLGSQGPIHADVAVAMAAGVRERCSSDLGIATTGVAGPDPQDGHAPGEVYVAVVYPGGSEVRGLTLEGDRSAVRAATVAAAIDLAASVVIDASSLSAS